MGAQKYPGEPGIRDQGLTCYLGNSGTTSTSFDGVLYFKSKITLPGISDGTSNTILVGERPPNSNLEFGWWFAAYGYDGRGNADCVMTSNDVAAADYFIANYNSAPNQPCNRTPAQKIGLQPGNVNVGCDAAHYWSFHSGGAPVPDGRRLRPAHEVQRQQHPPGPLDPERGRGVRDRLTPVAAPGPPGRGRPIDSIPTPTPDRVMRTILLAVVLALGFSGLTGCGDSSSDPPKAADGVGGPPPQNSGAGKQKGGRIPGAPK